MAEVSKSLQAKLKKVDVTVERARAIGGASLRGISTFSSACTSACFSSASTICGGISNLKAAEVNPEMAKTIASLHEQGVRVLGEEGLAKAIAAQAKKTSPVTIKTTAATGAKKR
jgi:hypothetical protein